MNKPDTDLFDAALPEINASLRQESPVAKLARIITHAARFKGDTYGLDMGERATLARLDPDAPLRPHQIAALSRALVCAGFSPEAWKSESWQRWALIAHGMALAGHDGSQPLGKQLSDADVSASRVTRLLNARDDAFRQLLPRLLRLMASKTVAPNWFDLAELVKQQDSDDDAAEAIRLRIASYFFAAEAKKSQH